MAFPYRIQFDGENPPIYETYTTERWPIGTKLQMGDKVYVFCRANTGGELNCQQSATNQNAIDIAYTTVAVNAAAGDKEVYVTKASASEDDYKGGHVILGHNSSATTQNRGIIASSATDSDGYVKLTLDGKLQIGLTAGTSGIEVMKSIYSSVAQGDGSGHSASGYKASVCVPCVYVATTAGEYFWGQTWGPIWLTPGATGYGATANERMLIFDGYGSVQDFTTVNHTGAEGYQLAGFLLDNTSSPEDCSFVMLQISP